MRRGGSVGRLLLIAALPLLAGTSECDDHHYRLELRPEGAELRRTVTVTVSRPSKGESRVPGAEELQRVAASYPAPQPSSATRGVFTATFAGETPPDVGGAGRFVHLETTLGTASTYVERFRGRRDQAAFVAESLASIDCLVDLLDGWIAAEIASHPERGRVHTFLDERVRGDLKDLFFYFYLDGAAGESRSTLREAAFFHRVLLHLAERGYLTAADLPLLADPERGAGAAIAIAQRLLARELGAAPQDAIPHELAFLSSQDSAGEALARHVRGTPEFQARLASAGARGT